MNAPSPPPFAYARQVFLAVSGLAFGALVLAGGPVILPFLLAVLVAYVLFPAVHWCQRRLRFPRALAILAVYLVMLGAMAGFGWAVVPRLFEETKKLAAELPKLTSTVRDRWLPALDARLGTFTRPPEPPPDVDAPPPDAPPVVITRREDGSYEIRVEREVELRQKGEGTWVLAPPQEAQPKSFSSARALRDAFDKAIRFAQTNAIELLAVGRAVVGGISRGIFYFFLTLMLAGYIMFTYERIHGFVREMWPEQRRPAFDRFLRRLDRGMAGVVRGQLLICLVNGVLSAIGFYLFDLKYWPILSMIAAIMSIIPIFGSILSSIPAVAIGLTQGIPTALWVLLWIVGIHQLEANFLNPKIIGDQAKIHPVLVVFSLLIGEHFFQITGALLAVPTLALVQAVFLHFRESVLGLHDERPSTNPDVPQKQPPPELTDTMESRVE